MIQIEYEKGADYYNLHDFDAHGSLCRWVTHGRWRGLPINNVDGEYGQSRHTIELAEGEDSGWFTMSIDLLDYPYSF